MSSIPTMFEILSWYLYGQQTKPEDYLDEKYIGRPVNNDTDKIGSVVYVNATEFMTTGAGRYVDVGNFKAVRKFLAGEYNLAPKTYTTEQFFDAIGYPDYKTNKGAHLGVSNYGLDTGSEDYLDRAYVFGSMDFMINENAKFIVEEDGTFRIENIAVVPVEDNFNYQGGGIAAGVTNFLTEDVIDPYGIGRKVSIVFEDIIDLPKVDLSHNDLPTLNAQQNYFDSINSTIAGEPLPDFVKIYNGLLDILDYDLTNYFDANNRLVVYGTLENDTPDVNAIKLKYITDLGILSASIIVPASLNPALLTTVTALTAQLHLKIASLISKITDSNGVYYISGNGNDNVEGTNSNDKILGGDGDDTLFGGFGNDHLIGGNDNDILRDASGDDILEGGSGNDTLIGGHDSDKLYGGDNDDFLYGDFENEMISLVNSGGDDLLEGGLGADHLYGGKGSDILYANKKIEKYELDLLDNNSNILVGGDGGDILIGGMGDDILIAGESEFDDSDEYSNELYGGLGADTLYGAAGDDHLYAMGKITSALDVNENILYGGGGNDKLYGSYGDDIIYTGSTNTNKTFFGRPDGDDIGTKNEVHGYEGTDKIYGEDGEDKIYGDEGEDLIEGNRGNDVLFGGGDDDELYGGFDHDVLAGGAGNDTLSGGQGGDVLMGDIGYDTYNYTVRENKISQGWSWVDHIYDLDGLGEIRMDTMFTMAGQQFLADSYKLQVGQKVGYNTWLSTNQQYYITRYEKTRLVLDYEGSDETFKDLYNPLQNDSREYHLIIQSANHFEHQYHVWFWKSGDLGLVIPNQPAPPPPQPPTPRVPNPPPPPRDPLSLDLDNDGKISTLSKNPGVYFDLDNSNFAEKTSWIAPQDGLLVLDRNGNGKIDGGAELFGTETFLADGSLAGNGYIALQELDDNHDGEISEADVIYHQLRVWQDINSNGVSESNELKSLQELNIKSINLNYESHSTVDENNVEHRENSTFTYLDETTGITNTLWFDTDRQDSVPVVIHNGAEIPIDEDIQLLPELAGFGNVYSLHHAMQLDTTGKLKELVKEFVAQFEDNQARLDLVEQIILQWTGVAQVQSNSLGVNINAQHVRALEKLLGNQAAATVSQAEFVGIEQVYQQNFKYVYTMLMQQSHSAHLFHKIEFIDQGNGQWTADFTQLNQYIINTVAMESISENTLKFVKDMYPILEGIDPYNSKIFNTFKQTLDQALESNLSQEDYDLVKKYLSTDESIFGTTEADEISITESKANSPIFLLDGDDILNGGQGKDLVYGNKGNDQLLGLGGHDELYGGEGDDGLYGGTGEDILYGDSGNDRLEGGADSDQLYGGAGNDILIGGADGDYLYGGIGNDTYIFAANFGHDIINNHDATQDRQDIIQFTDSFVQSDFTYRRNNDDLIISTLDSLNSIRVQSYFQSDALGQYRVDQIQFSDGAILDIEAVKALVLIGTEKADILRAYTTGSTISGEAGDDVIHGNIGADQLYGGDGLDRLYGGDGNDELRGGIGDDILEGGVGDDILEGGQGSDLLQGGSGDDIYILNVDSGQDTIIDGNGSNLIKLNNILQEEVLIDFASDNKNDIQINYGLDNKLIIKNFFNSNFSLEFDDGTIWNKYEIASKIIVELMGTNQIDQLHGHAYVSDHIQGLESNDVIYAYAGNDTLNGGTGNDYLEGGTGNDTYIFAANFGHDIINNYDSGQNRQDIIQFTDGLTQGDFTFRRNNDDLVIRTLNGENSITVQNYFQSDALGHYRIDQIQFSDSTTLDIEAVKALVLLGTAEADVLRAYTTGSTISGEAGDDVIHGNIGSDQLYGGDGQDQLYGDNGNDHLEGGADNDQLYAGNGNDVLIGGSGNDLLDAGDGSDQLYGGTGNDVLNGGAGNDLLDGGDGSDQLNGGTGDDILVGGTGDDVLIGGQGNDTYRLDLAWGQDTIQYESKNQTDIDTIEFININPDDLIVRKVGQDMVIIHRITGDQLIVESQFSDYLSNKSINKVRFDDQTEWDEAALNIQAVKGTELDDIIEGTTDHDVIHAGDGDDIVYGRSVYSETPETQYFVYGGAGNDKIYATGYLDGGAGDDEIEGAGHLLGGEGNDILNGQGVLEGQAGNDTLTGQGKLYGGDGQDHLTLTGLYGDELGLLAGGSGDDILIVDVNRRQFVNGSNQNEFIQDDDGYHAIQDTELTEAQRAVYVEGGQGNDTIYGSFGDEVYLFNLGDGQDTIIKRPAGQNYSNVTVSFDVLRFGQGIATTDISLHRYGNDLIIQHGNQTDQVTIQNYFTGGHHKVNEIQFADSTTWNNSYIENHVIYHGTANNDEVWGYRDTHETFEMGAGDDKVYSGAGNDIIYGQAGDDTLWGQAGNDTLYGGIGADYLEGNEGDDILYGDQDNDILYGGAGNDILYGGQGDDTLRGGTGHNILDGGAGNDKYFYYLADGTEIIDQTGGGTDVLWLMDQGITEDRIKFTKENNDLIVTIDNNPNQSVRVKDHFLGGEKAISSVQPNGGYTITAAQIAVKVNASSGGSSDPAGDTIYQYTSGAMTITEQSGNDTVLFKNGITFSQVGNYLTKSGDDLILKVNGSNTNKVTIKNFFKAGQYLVETLQFETGGQLTAEQIFGAFGLTIPSGTAPTPPNPVGDTTYNYSSGELTITEQLGNDKVIFKNGITFSQVGNYLTKSGDDLILKVNGSNTNKVTVKNFFLAGNYLVENFEFETGGNLTAEQVFGAFGLTLPSTSGSGNEGSSEVAGDTIYNYTTGALTITEHSGNDKVIFKNGITFNQVGSYLTKSGDDLILKVNGSNTNKVTVKNFFLAGQYLVETFQFETGGQITAEQIFEAFGITMPQQSAPANTAPENMDLDAFNTTYNYSSGAMVIDEKLGTDQVVFGNGITFSQVGNYLTKSGDDLILKVNGSNSNKVTVKDFFLGGAHEVESFNFETGGSISSQQIYQVFGVDRPVNAEDEVTSIVTGDSGDNVLSSDAAVSELFILNEGNDILELLLNASGETAVDYVTDFDMAEDQIDLSQILDSHATSSNLSSYIEIIYDTDAKTNTLSVRGQSNQAYKDVLVMTNQSEQLYLQDLINNQSLIY